METFDNNELAWYGVVHTDGRFSIKIYLSWGDYIGAGDSTFTAYVTKLFNANTREEAVDKALRLCRPHLPLFS